MAKRKRIGAKLWTGSAAERAATCCNCGHAFMATPCPGRNFVERPRRCQMTRGWIPISAMFEPIGDDERQRIIDEEMSR